MKKTTDGTRHGIFQSATESARLLGLRQPPSPQSAPAVWPPHPPRAQGPEETSKQHPLVERIERNPKYQQLKATRTRLGWWLTILMLIVYYGYIGLIAFDKALLAKPIGAGVTTLGIPLGMAVIVFTVAITGIYVRRANKEFDALTRDILKDATK